MGIIKNFGHLWEKRHIYRGGGRGRLGDLLGYNSRVDEANFRDQIGIYVLYDKNFSPIYVGQTGYGEGNRLLKRLKTHSDGKLGSRWEYFSWFGLRRVNVGGTLSAFDKPKTRIKGTIETTLDEIEGVLIEALEPRHNRQGAIWKDTEPFYQYLSDDVKELDDVYRKLESIEKLLMKPVPKRKKLG